MSTFYVITAIFAISDVISLVQSRDKRTIALYCALLGAVVCGAIAYDHNEGAFSFVQAVLRLVPW